MILHIALAGIHIRRPTAADVKKVASFAAVGAAIPAALLAARYGLVWPALCMLAALFGAVAGSRRTGKRWQRRYERFAAAVDVNNRAIHLQLAQYERVAVERWNAEAAERNGRWIDLNDSHARPGVGQPNKGYR